MFLLGFRDGVNLFPYLDQSIVAAGILFGPLSILQVRNVFFYLCPIFLELLSHICQVPITL